MSPAFMLYGRQLRDALPHVPQGLPHVDRYGPVAKSWEDIKRQREVAHSRKQATIVERYNRDKRPLSPLSVGDSVSMQNQRGSCPNRWERTGLVVERLANRQYLVKCDGSGTVLLRTRAHLRKIDPGTRYCSAADVDGQHPTAADQAASLGPDPLLLQGHLRDGTEVVSPIEGVDEQLDVALPDATHDQDGLQSGSGTCDDPEVTNEAVSPPVASVVPPVASSPVRRRTTRVRRPRRPL